MAVPNTTTFTLWDVLDAVYGSHASGNLADAFDASDAAKFDLSHGSKTMSPKTMLGFQNYGAACTRPGGLLDLYFIYSFNYVTVTIDNVFYYAANHDGAMGAYQGESAGNENDPVYSGHGGTDCTKVADGIYVMTDYAGSFYSAVQITSGILHYLYS